MKKSIITIFASFFLFNINAQIDLGNTRDGESVEYCLHHKKMKELKNNPAFLQQFIADQAIMREVEEQMTSNPNPTRVIYKIPVVFHVLHNGGPENISNAQILDALEILNRDYNLLNADANNVQTEFNASNPNAVANPANCEFQFVMATKAPDGTCFSGITRTQSTQTSSGNGSAQVNAIVNGNDVYNGQWAGNKYLNFFICAELGGAAGYTFTPSNWGGTAMDNGIWILHDYVGSIGTGGVGTDRALTHEVGHWLNLEHTWGPNNNPGDQASCSSDDGVTDTPNTKGVTACILGESSCGPKANVENYMDYSYCSKMFTGGQKTRMIAALNSSVGGRNNLSTAPNLVATGADGNTYLCAADFYADLTTVCTGTAIQFNDNSYNNVTSWNWSFPGADTPSSTDQNPIVTYSTPGVYQVSLVAGDGNITMTKTRNSYIIVNGTGLQMPFLDGFETYASLASSNYWTVDNQQNNNTFEVTSTAGHTGVKSVKLANFGQSGDNIDELIGNPVDLSSVISSADVTLSFRFSYRKRNSTNAERLFILLTGNCGDTWEIRKTLQGSALSNTVVTSSWTPSVIGDWTTVHLTNIGAQYWNENFRYKFKFDANGGNNLFLDNINIYASGPSEDLVDGSANVIENDEFQKSVSIYPNPAEGELNVSFSVEDQTVTTIKILDLIGQEVIVKKIKAAIGNNLVVIGTEGLASGVYTALINMNGSSISKQVIIK